MVYRRIVPYKCSSGRSCQALILPGRQRCSRDHQRQPSRKLKQISEKPSCRVYIVNVFRSMSVSCKSKSSPKLIASIKVEAGPFDSVQPVFPSAWCSISKWNHSDTLKFEVSPGNPSCVLREHPYPLRAPASKRRDHECWQV